MENCTSMYTLSLPPHSRTHPPPTPPPHPPHTHLPLTDSQSNSTSLPSNTAHTPYPHSHYRPSYPVCVRVTWGTELQSRSFSPGWTKSSHTPPVGSNNFPYLSSFLNSVFSPSLSPPPLIAFPCFFFPHLSSPSLSLLLWLLFLASFFLTSPHLSSLLLLWLLFLASFFLTSPHLSSHYLSS